MIRTIIFFVHCILILGTSRIHAAPYGAHAEAARGACDELGGKTVADEENFQSKCLCSDGVEIVAPQSNSTRCLDHPKSAEEIAKDCESYSLQNVLFKELALTFDELEAFAKKADSRDVFFEKMKSDEVWKIFLKSYVPLKSSQSQEAIAVDPKFPRRLMFHRGVLMASTSHPDYPGYNGKIPVFLADTKEKRKMGWKTAMLSWENGEAKLRPNPSSCKNCHGDPPRPNVPSYQVCE